MKTVVILSGGLDSTTALYKVIREGTDPSEIIAVTFAYGQTHAKEIDCARYQAEKVNVAKWMVVNLTQLTNTAFKGSALTDLGVQSIPDIKDAMGDPQPVTYVPNRNMIMLSIAAAIAEGAGARYVVYGAQKHDMYGYWDTTPEFVFAMNKILSLNRKTPVVVTAPLMRMSKTDVLESALEMGVDVAHTWSCYKGGEKACGVCPTCAERLKAFENIGATDPLPYEDKEANDVRDIRSSVI